MSRRRVLIAAICTLLGMVAFPGYGAAQKFGTAGVSPACGLRAGCGVGFGACASYRPVGVGFGYTPPLYPNGTDTARGPAVPRGGFCTPRYCPPCYAPLIYTTPYYYNSGYLGYGYQTALYGNGAVPAAATEPNVYLTETVADSRVAKFTVRCPANAQLYFDSCQLPDTGSTRYFRTPKLYREKNFNYQVKAHWYDQNGRLVKMSRKIEFHPGDRIVLDFSNPTATAQGN